MDIAITRMSSKGQIIVPKEMRKGIRKGEKLVVIKNKDQLIMKKASKFSKNIEEDLEFARRTEEAWKAYDSGEFTEMDYDKFLKEVKKW